MDKRVTKSLCLRTGRKVTYLKEIHFVKKKIFLSMLLYELTEILCVAEQRGGQLVFD